MEQRHLDLSDLNLDDLPSEVLVLVFRYLDQRSLCRTAQVCRYFNDLASVNELWRKWANECIIVSSKYGLSTRDKPKLKEQCRLSTKWRRGRCKTKNVLKFGTNLLPWLSLSPNHSELYIAVGDTIKKYSSKCWMNNNFHKHETCTVHSNFDISRFCITDHYIVSGSRGWQHGKLSCSSSRDLNFTTHDKMHESDVSDVAVLDNVIISGSRDHTVKVWKICDEGRKLDLLSKTPMHDTVLSVAVNKFRRVVAIGTGGIGGVHPLQIKDLKNFSHLCSLGTFYKNGAGVLDCHFLNPDLLMSAGYDTYVRLWDTRMRTSSCVRAWEEPHDNAVYCVASDNRYGFVSGSCRHGVTRLWDTRMKNSLQTFYLGGKVSSPVYSLTFTHSHLFAGLSRGVIGLDFR